MPLVEFQRLMRDASQGCYAVGYFESWSLESLLAVADAAEAKRSPVILGFSGIYLPHPDRVATDALAVYAAMGYEVCNHLSVPACLLFNECPIWEWVQDAVRLGFGLVMYSDEALAPQERTKRISALAAAAHRTSQAVEAELFALPGISGEELGANATAQLTDPDDAQRFVQETGVDALAVNVGQIHLHGRRKVGLNLDRLVALRRAVATPLVLHGATSVDRGDLRQAIEIGIQKVNVGSALKQAYFAALREACVQHSDVMNPYEVLGSGMAGDVLMAGRQAMQQLVEDWMELLSSAGRAK